MAVKIHLTIMLFALVALRGSSARFVPKEYSCTNGLFVICASPALRHICNKEEDCKIWDKKSPCDKGPEVFCSSPELIAKCDKQISCAPWLDSSVSVVKLEPKPWYSPDDR